MFFRRDVPVLFGVLLLAEVGCTTGPEDEGGFSSFNATLSTSVTLTSGNDVETDEGDGDGDTSDSGDGDGDSGDGDGDSGDGDGDSGDGDGDGDSGDGDGEPGCDWMPNPDQNPAAACDPILQNCPVGNKCVAYISGGASWDNNKCVPVSGSKVPGQACTVEDTVSSIDDCNADGQCFNLDVDNTGTCLAFCGCTYEEPECAVGSNCLVANQGSLALCVEQCDPLAQNCPLGQGCYVSGETLICAATTSNIPAGEPCGFINDCEPGTACYNVDACGGACCTPFCDVNGNDAECAVLPGTTCQAANSWGICN